MTRSLRSRLLWLLLGATLLVWACTAFFVYRDARHEVDELFDAQLAQTARLLLRQAEATVEEDDEGLEIDTDDLREHMGHHYEQKLYFSIREARGDLLLTSSRRIARQRAATETVGFDTADAVGQSWRFFSLYDDERHFRVEVGQRLDIRGELAKRIAVQVLHPLAIFLPLFGLLIWFSVGRALRPLRDLAAEVSQRDPRNLTPVDVSPPAEVVPLVDSLNSLLGRVNEAFERERRFTADAAHELRTPLAALSTHAQLAASARNENERGQSMAHVLEGIERMSRLVQQLLTLARMDPLTPSPDSPVNLTEVARTVIARLAPSAVAKEQEIELDAARDFNVCGEAVLLDVLCGNLVENAIRYTPAGGKISVTVAEHQGEVRLRVEDTGPGVPPDALERLTERFFRVVGASASGSGLGLSIVHRIAELLGARLTFASPPGKGLRVEVVFPQAPAVSRPLQRRG